MYLEKLYEQQRKTMQMFEKNHPKKPGENRFEKKILALLVEVGECANEYRGFKYWSQDQEPRTWEPNPKDICKSCKGNPMVYENGKIVGQCEKCDGCGVYFHNPLLEEYADGLHFILELGIEVDYTPIACYLDYRAESIDSQFIALYKYVLNFLDQPTREMYENLLMVYIGLGKMLGFMLEEIEQAYWTKNKVNYERQENGY